MRIKIKEGVIVQKSSSSLDSIIERFAIILVEAEIRLNKTTQVINRINVIE